MLIDVNVVDKTAHPVSSLKAEDFAVTVDRKPRKIVSAVYIDHGVGPGVKASPAPEPAPADAPVPAAVAPPAVRNILMVVDEDSLDSGDGLMARRTAIGFLDQLPAVDRVGVVAIPRSKVDVTLATDRAFARKALEAILTGRDDATSMREDYNLSTEEAYEIDRDPALGSEAISRECKCNYLAGGTTGCSAMCVREVIIQARRMAMAAKMRAQRSIDALRALASGMQKIQGPKTVVLVSGGLPIPETTAVYPIIEQAFAAAQISLYTLYVERVSFGQVNRKPSPDPRGDDRIESFGLENITSVAGGTFIPIIGQMEPYFERVAIELSGSYLLGIEVAAGDRDGRPHQVEVRVNRPGLDVRSRRQYVIEPDKRVP